MRVLRVAATCLAIAWAVPVAAQDTNEPQPRTEPVPIPVSIPRTLPPLMRQEPPSPRMVTQWQTMLAADRCGIVSSLQRAGIDTLTLTMPFRGTPSMQMLTLPVDYVENGNLPPLPAPASLATLGGEPIATGFVGYRTVTPPSYRITWTLTEEVIGQLHAAMQEGLQLYVDVPGVTTGQFPLDLHSNWLVSLEGCRELLGERLKAARPPGEALDVVDRDPVLNQQTSRLDLMQYPSRAMREGVEGTVKASMQVDEYGYIAECTVAVSSGSTYLDDATCRDLKRYARFYPARDASGEAAPGTYFRDVRWELED